MTAHKFQKERCHFVNPGIIVFAATSIAACGTTTTQAKSRTTPSKSLPPTPGTVVPALNAHYPATIVTRSKNLLNGEKVKVTVTGFGAGGEFFLSECVSATNASSAG